MPLGEIAGEVLGGLLRLIGHIFVELVLEVMIRGVGYFICRLFSEKIDSSSVTVLLVGVLFWIVIGAGVLVIAFWA